MNKKEFRLIVYITVLTVFVVTITAILFVLDFYIVKQKRKELNAACDIYINLYKEGKKEELKKALSASKYQNVKISVFTEEAALQEVLYIPDSMSQSPKYSIKDDEDFHIAKNSGVGFNRYIPIRGNISLTRKIEGSPNLYLRITATRDGIWRSFGIIVVIIGVVLFIGIFTSSYIARGKTFEGALNSFRKIEQSLNVLKTDSEFANIVIDKEDPKGLQELHTSINEVGQLLAKNISATKASDERSTFILNNMSQAFFGINRKGRILLSNSAAAKLVKQNIVPGDEMQKFLTPEGAKSFDEVLRFKKEVRTELEIANTVCKVDMIFFEPIKMGDSDLELHGMLLATNIDSAKKAEILKDEFFVNASHELKTPMTAIKGYSEILSKNVKTKIQKKCSDEIAINIERLENLTNNMFDFSHIDEMSEKLLKDKETIDVRECVLSLFKTLGIYAQDKNVQLEVVGEGSIFANYDVLKNILENLIKNAIKYNKKDGVVKVEIHDQPKYLIINVKDTGIGLTEEEQSRVFERFYTADKSERLKDFDMRSTGLGLSIVKKLVELLKGEIDLTSEKNVGTNIRVKIPR